MNNQIYFTMTIFVIINRTQNVRRNHYYKNLVLYESDDVDDLAIWVSEKCLQGTVRVKDLNSMDAFEG